MATLYYMQIRILSSQTNKTESTASPAQPSNLINDGTSGDNVCKAVQENKLTSHGLPKNWIKELKPRKNGTKADPVRLLLFVTCYFVVFFFVVFTVHWEKSLEF